MSRSAGSSRKSSVSSSRDKSPKVSKEKLAKGDPNHLPGQYNSNPAKHPQVHLPHPYPYV